MHRSSGRLSMIAGLFVLMTWLSVCPWTSAGELRTSSQSRAVTRQVAYQAQIEPQPMSFDEPTYDHGGMVDCPSCHDPACGWDCFFPHGMYARFEYLIWWQASRSLPPLATTSPTGTGLGSAGVLGQPGTTILFGNSSEGGDAQPGGRLTLGAWLDDCRLLGVEGRFFALDDSPLRFVEPAGNLAILAQPFFDVSTGQQDARVLSFPNIVSGELDVLSESKVYGADVYLRRFWCADLCGAGQIDFVAGYQFSRVDENLRIGSVRTALDPAGVDPIGTVFTTSDVFDVRNEFHGGSIGLLAEWDRGCWQWNVLAKVGLGNMQHDVSIRGNSTTSVPGLPTVASSTGFLALPTNIGTFSSSQFAVVPEVNLNLRWNINDCLNLSCGYSFLYWDKVMQAGDLVDTSLNPTQVPGPIVGPARPEFGGFTTSDFFVHGVNFGVEARY